MQKFGQRRGAVLYMTLLTAGALVALPISASAKDLPPTPEGAQKLSETLAAYLGKPAAGAPSAATVTAEGNHYTAVVDLANLYAPLSGAGLAVDPAVLKYLLTQQDDGTWRVATDSLPPISFRTPQMKIAYNFGDYKFDGVFDPALAWFKSGQGSLAKATLEAHTPQIDETVAIGAVRATLIGTPAANGAVSLAAHEELADVSANVTPVAGSGKEGADTPPPVSFQIATAVADVSADGAPIRKLLDVWTFLAAHPSRPEIAANEPAFKGLLRALLPADLKLAEKVELKDIAVGAPQGRFTVSNGKFAFSAATAPGAKGSAEYSFAVEGFSMPPGLLPPAMSDLVPTVFNLGIKASGFDAGAGAEEAINDMHFAGDGPVIAATDRDPIVAKMKGNAPIAIELLPSHIVAPQIDLTVEGQVHIEGVRASGVLKVRVRNFDKTVAAIKALGPLATPQLMGGLALAKTLGKSESDGALSWLAEYSPEGAIKVNGMPLGKAPQ